MKKRDPAPVVVDIASARRERERSRYAALVMDEFCRQERADRHSVRDLREDAHFKAKDRF